MLVEARNITESPDSTEPDDWVSRLLRLLERSRGEFDGDPVKDRRAWRGSCSSEASGSYPYDGGVSL